MNDTSIVIADQRTIYAPSIFSTVEQVEAHWILIGQRAGFLRDGLPTMRLEPTGRSVRARVDHGRWLADCECGGAMACWVENPRAACLGCGRIYEVSWPSEREEGEALLLARPLSENRNWTPGEETLGDLRAENQNARRLGLIS